MVISSVPTEDSWRPGYAFTVTPSEPEVIGTKFETPAGILVSPDPATQFITLRGLRNTEAKKIRAFDLTGRPVLAETYLRPVGYYDRASSVILPFPNLTPLRLTPAQRMKPYLLFPLFLLFFSIHTDSLTAQDLTFRKLGGRYLFALDNKVLTTAEVAQIMPAGSRERRLLAGSSSNEFFGDFFQFVGSFTAGYVIGDMLFNDFSERRFRLIGGGIAVTSFVLALPFHATAKRQVNEAVSLYNGVEVPLTYRPCLGVSPSDNGLALVLTF